MRTRPRALLSGVAALLATFAMATPASAQVMTFTGATPSTYSGPGETITFHVSLGGSNAVTNSVELTRIAYGAIGPISCVGLPLDPLESTTCSFSYVTQAGDVFGLNQSGTYKVTTLAAPRTKNIANTWMVPYVPVPPTASIVASTASVLENGAQSLSYTVTLSDPAAAPISVYFALGGSASAGVDYTASANPLVIATGSTTGTITLDPTGDTDVEPDESVTVSLVAGSGYTLGAPSSASGTIANDDVSSLSINDVTLAEGNAGTTNATFTVSLSLPAGPGGVSFDIASASGTATAGVDYVASNLAGQTIPAGSSTYSFTVPVNGDTLNEPGETFFVNVTNVTNVVVVKGQGVGTIVNDDAQPGLSIGNASVTEGNAGSVSASFVVTLSAASGQTVTVNYATADGTATAGSDYVAASGTLVFAPGETSKTLTVLVNGDTTVESDETFSVGLSGAANASIATATGTSTILNDDVVVTVNPSSLPNPVYAAAYSQSLTGGGGSGPYSFVVTSGALPAGLVLSTGGLLSGTPTVTGNFNPTVTATDANGISGSRAYALAVSPPTITVAPTTLPAATTGSAYSQSVVAASGIAPYAYTVSAGALPAGLTLSSTGTLSGTPSAGGSFNFTLRATDANGFSGARAYNLNVNASTISIVPATMPNGTVASSYNLTVSAAGGTAPYAYAVSAGALPAGLSLAGNGNLSGTPTAGGTFNFTVTATDGSTGVGAPYSGSRAYSLVVAAPTIAVAPSTLPGGTVAASYSQVVTASGGTAPYAFTVTAGALPAGLSLAANGSLSGTPTAGGTFNFTVTATDSSTGSGPFTGSRAYAVTVAAPTITLPATSLADGVRNTAYSATLNPASGGTAPYSYAISGGALPTGISLAADGSLGGSPTAIGTFFFTVTATDSSTGAGPYTDTRAAFSLTIIDNAPVAGAVSAAVAYGSTGNPITLSLSGGVPISIATPTTPIHGTVAVSGTSLTYTPTAGYAGPDSFTYTASNGGGTSAPATVTVAVGSPTITVAASGPLAATVAVPYSQTFTWSGGAAPYTGFTVTGLPAGLAVTATSADSVTVSGTPTAGGSFALDASATDSSTGNGPFTVGQAFMLTLTAPALALAPVAGTLTADYNVAYSQNFSASGGTGPYSYALASGSLPTGVSFSSSGLLSGAPTSPGSYAFAVRATDSSTGAGSPYSVSNNYVLVVGTPTITLAPAILPDGVAGTAYNATLGASGGAAPYSYALLSGALPIGMTFDSAGQFSGIPRSDGSFSLTVRATDANGQTGASVFNFNIAAPTLAITPAALPAGTTNIAYSANLSTSGGIAPYAYSLVSGSLPVGMSFSSAGVFSGTPTTAGTYNTTVRSTDDAGYTVDVVYTIAIDAPVIVIDPATLADGNVGTAYTATLTASGGAAPYSYSLSSGALPVGMTFSSAGQLSGTPRSDGGFSLSVRATDANGNTGTRTYSFNIAAPTLAISPATLPAGTTNIAYSQSLATSGGIAPYAYSLVSGSLPVGMSFSSAGVFSGTPTIAGNYTATIRSTDAAGYTVDVVYTIAIVAPVIVVDPPTLDAAVVGDAYAMTLTATGGAAPYAFALESGSLPPGISLGSAGGLSGTPNASGTFNFDVRATDSNGNRGTRAYVLVVVPRTLVLDPATLVAGIAGSAYSQSVSASGGIAPYSYALSSGALPPGLALANGVISGTPTASGSFTFGITASDSGGGTPATTTRSYTLVIAVATLSLDPASLPAGIAGNAYSQSISASGGIAPYSYALSSGALPAGLTFANGLLSGTPTVSGSFSFDIAASDSTGGTAATVTRNFTLVIAVPVISIAPGTLADGVRGSAYSQALSASGGTAAYAFALGGGALPPGISLAGDGTLAGTPTADGSFSFAVTVTDALGFTATANYTWVVAMDPPVVVDDEVATLGGAVVSIPVTTNDTGAITSIAIAASPAHGTATVNGLEVAYTPEAGFTGTDRFHYTATGPGGTSAPATVTVTVNPLPVAVSRRLTANAGVAVEVDLTEGATGGPFTAATIVSLSPANAGTANIAQVGSGDAARYVLTYTPAAVFSGLATVRFTLGNAYATSAEATLEFDVTGRPDPSQDPEVRALLAAQAASTRRFATAQINNFQQRLENMHGAGDSRFSNQVSFSADSDRDCENQVGRIPGRRCEHQARNDEVAHAAAVPADTGNAQGAVFGTWVGGVIRSGNHDGRGGSAGVDFESDGLSVGADYRLNAKFAFGGGLGWGRDDSDVGEHGSRSEGKAYTAALYASYHPGDRLFVDGLMGYQDLSYDLRRHVTSNGALVQGARDGSQWFASLSAGADIRHGERLQLTPYARLDLARATLDAYTEHGDPLYSLHYADMDVDTTTGNLGLRVDYRHKLSQGLFSPQLRLEYQHDFQGNGDATMGYADQLSGPFYRTGVEAFDRNRFVIGLGAQFSTDSGLSTRIEYRGVVGDGEDSDHGLMLNIEKRY